MIDSKPFISKGFHLAGIIPVAGQPHDFNFDWHDSLMPIAQNYIMFQYTQKIERESIHILGVYYTGL